MHEHIAIEQACLYEETTLIIMLKQELKYKGASFLASKSVQSCSDVFLCYRGHGYILQEKNFNSRVETYVALRFQGINAQKVAKQDIQTTENGWYTVQSQTVRGEYYSVNTTIGFCTCLKGKDGSPCVHQAAVVIQCGEYGLNFSTSASSSARQKLAQIALGDGAIQDAGFYSSLHQESLEGHSTCQNRNNYIYRQA